MIQSSNKTIIQSHVYSFCQSIIFECLVCRGIVKDNKQELDLSLKKQDIQHRREAKRLPRLM